MDQLNVLMEPIRVFLGELGHFLPRALLAAVILAAGWLTAKALRFAALRALRAMNFQVITEKAGVDRALVQGGFSHDTSGILGLLVYWGMILVALVVAFNTLGLSEVTDLIGRLLLFVTSLGIAVVALVLGAYFARFVAGALENWCRSAGIADAALIGRLAFYAILVFVGLAVLDQLNITGELLRASFLILFGGIVFGLALAFGLGAQQWAADLIQRWRSNSGGTVGRR